MLILNGQIIIDCYFIIKRLIYLKTIKKKSESNGNSQNTENNNQQPMKSVLGLKETLKCKIKL